MGKTVPVNVERCKGHHIVPGWMLILHVEPKSLVQFFFCSVFLRQGLTPYPWVAFNLTKTMPRKSQTFGHLPASVYLVLQ